MPDHLRIHLLGPPAILVGKLHAPRFPTESVKHLFYYLVLFRHAAHTREELAGLMWPNSADREARHSLRTALWRLREWMGQLGLETESYLIVEHEQVAFNPASPHWLDAEVFEKRVQQARQIGDSVPHQATAILSRAVELYRGELLLGCYSDWCLAERTRLHQMYLGALSQLMTHCIAQHDYVRAIGFGRRVLQEDPLRESVHRDIIRLLALTHHEAEALQQYERCENALRDELGVEPMPETQALYRRLLSHSILAGSARTNGLDGTGRRLEILIERLTALREQLDVMQCELAQAIEASNNAKGMLTENGVPTSAAPT